MTEKTLKIIAIIAYLFIILAGEMIGLPFFLWLLYTLLDFGNSAQLFALTAVIGLILSLITMKFEYTFGILVLDIICFFLLLSPIIERMSVVPIENFNYLAFIIPTFIFAFLYFLSIFYALKKLI